jgi:hypothetical protein
MEDYSAIFESESFKTLLHIGLYIFVVYLIGLNFISHMNQLDAFV